MQTSILIGVLLHLRAYRVGRSAVVASTVVITAGVITHESLRSPVTDGLVPLLAPLLAGVTPAIAATGLLSPTDEMERATWRSPASARAGLAGAYFCISAAAACGIAALLPGAPALALRAALLCAGITLLCAEFLPPDMAWLPLCVILPVTFLFGSDRSGSAYSWAIPLQPVGSATAWLTAFGCAAGGLALYSWRGAAVGQ